MPDVEHHQLKTTSTSVAAVATALKDVDVAGPCAPIQQSMVGSQTSQGALWLSTRLAAGVLVHAEAIGSLSDATGTSATQWEVIDDDAHRGLGPGRP